MVMLWLCFSGALLAGSLTTLDYRLASAELQVSPAVVSVPKGIAGSVLVQVVSRDGGANDVTQAMAAGAYVEAILRGPSFEPRRVVGLPNAALVLPPLSLVGDYRLDNVRLVDAASGAVRLEGVPSSVSVHVFDDVLVSRVTSRPLTYEEIREKGIVIDESNFRAVEFEVGFVLDGKTIPVKFPVVAPTFQQSTELIPKAELEAALVEAQIVNQQIALTAELPPELTTASLNFDVQGINFQPTEDTEQDLTLQIPPIPALMVVAGNIGFLNQFFSVQVFTENAAPLGSGLSVRNVRAELLLPPGSDQVGSTNYNQPGDDPLRFARVGPNKIIQPIVPVVRPGQDGKIGTADDIERLQPGEQGEGEFLVEGLQEGLHVMNLNLTADLEGLAAGVVKVNGKAAGSVLVRNPKFSMAFNHPRTVRFGEVYEAGVTILNTGATDANQVSVRLGRNSLSGAVLESDELVTLGNLAPGQSATARWRVRAQRTGAVSFSNLTTSENSVQGVFRLRMGVDERGVVLSPDTLAYPDYVSALPEGVRAAATRVLGQALSVATAPQLPAGVRGVARTAVTRRVLELAEAGQRLAYGDDTNRVFADLLLDWQGARNFSDGFDDILRATDAGREWREAIFAALEASPGNDGTARLLARAPDFAGRGEAWKVASASSAGLVLSVQNGTASADAARSDLPRVLGYGGSGGSWIVAPADPGCVFVWKATNAVAAAEIALLQLETNGTARQLRWTLGSVNVGNCFRVSVTDGSGNLAVDADGDGVFEGTRTGTVSTVHELPPTVVSVRQDLTVKAGRPPNPCEGPANVGNYGTVVGVLFNKPMNQAQVNQPTAYRLDNGVTAGSVQLQAGGRVALLNLRAPVSALRPRTLAVSGIVDPRGNAVVGSSQPVQSDVVSGAIVRGRVVRADGSSAVGAPVTLTMYDSDGNTFGDCQSFVVRVAQVFADERGEFQFDFVLAGLGYSVSATDVAGLPPEAVAALLQSTVDDQVSRSRLQALLDAPENKDTLLAAFAVGAMSQAVAKVEGLDRAVLRDTIPENSPRVGTEVPVALRFRGKATVTGQVLAADGRTPVAGAAVNLYPDPDSRLQGRGTFSGSDGRFAFVGVPLGIFSLNVQSPAGQFRTIAGEIVENGETKDFSVVLATNIVPPTALRGRVFDSDGVTPHGEARVLVGKFTGGTFGSAVALARANASGFWSVTNIPAGLYDVVAVSFDGLRKGERRDVAADAGVNQYVAIALQGVAIVKGRVEFPTGQPAANALVGGGDVLVRTDANGQFTLTGVPTGLRTITAGLARNPDAGIPFPRLGSAALDVVPGAQNSVLIRFTPAGRIVGRVYDATGSNVVPNVRVSLPRDSGFQWVNADAQGFYVFENMPMGAYTLSAPAGPVAKTDTSGLIQKLKSGSEEAMLAALHEAYEIFTGVADPYLNGQGASFNPLTWGYAQTELKFDGQTVVANLTYLRQGTIGGKVVNGQGVPIGARVRLTGSGPLANGGPGTVIRAEANSDPATGEFLFRDVVFEGAWELQVASPFYPQILKRSGISFPPSKLDYTNLVLAFPPVQEVNGRLVGHVYNPDGSLAGPNVSVHVSFGDLTVRTGNDGSYDTQIAIPAGGYSVMATNEEGLVGIAGVGVTAGVTNICDVRLQGKGSLMVLVRRADGSPAVGASVEVRQGNFPYESYLLRATNPAAGVYLDNVTEGCYAACASLVTGQTTIFGRSGGGVKVGEMGRIEVRLEPTATIHGRFVRRDGVTPVDAAQVAVAGLGFAITDTNGEFTLTGLPLRTYRLITQNPVTGVGASAYVTLNFDGEVKNLVLTEQFRGEVRGYVINSYNDGYVPGAPVTLQVFDDLTPPRFVTTGPDGAFSFPGTPASALRVSAEDPINHRRGGKSATLAEGVSVLSVDIPLEPLGTLAGQVFLPDGRTPAANAMVQILGNGVSKAASVDASGWVSFADLPFGQYTIRATDLAATLQHSVAAIQHVVNRIGSNATFAVTLPGVGRVSGTVVASDGYTPVIGARVRLVYQSPLFYGQTSEVFADLTGQFSFEGVPVGTYCLLAEFFVLGVNVTGTIGADGESDVLKVRLGSSGTVQGRLVRADGETPVAGAEIQLTFRSQSTVGGYAIARTLANGRFTVPNVPMGPFTLNAVASAVDGLARLNSAVQFNLETRELGDIVLDEAAPIVESVFPPNGSANQDPGIQPRLVFNEALDPASIDRFSLYFCSPTRIIDAIPILETTNGLARVVRLVRQDNGGKLDSQTPYDIVVLHKPYRGGVVSTDLVGRPLKSAFVSRFTTADGNQPSVVSVFPTNGAVQIDPRSVMRVSFNEPMRESNFVVTLNGPAGPVAGKGAVGLNGLVIAFTPDQLLPANARYTFNLSDARDLAGNLMDHSVTATFDTLDTIGPVVSSLRIAGNRPAVSGATVSIEAELTPDEPGASVRFTQDLQSAGVALAGTAGVYPARVTLPETGRTTVRAYGTDRYGNEGAFAELALDVVSNRPPTVSMTRGTPSSGAVPTSRSFTVIVGATDDYVITNLTVVAPAVGFVTNLPSGLLRAVTIPVPATMTAGVPIRVSAQALDGLGIASTVALLDLVTSDGSAPSVTVVSPAANTLVNPATPLVVTVSSADNSTGHTLELSLSGALSATQSTNRVATTNQAVTSTLTFNLNGAATNGTPLVLAVRGRDAAGNESVVTHSLRLPDRVPPRLVAVTPAPGAIAQSLWLEAVRYEFSEAIDTNSLSRAQFGFTNASGVGASYTVAAENDARFVRVVPMDLPLAPGATWSNRLMGSIADLAGNTLVQSNGATWPAAGVAYTFRTARVLATTPTDGASVVPGQTLLASVRFEAGLGASAARFVLNTNAPVDIPLGPADTNASVSLLLNADATTATLAITLLNSGRPSYALPLVNLIVRPRSGDDDGDGWLNGFEADRGMNPFVADADSADFDGDGLSNGVERLKGTDPAKRDTDGDGLWDGVETNTGLYVDATNTGTDPLNPDTDGDQLADGTDPSPTHADTAPTLTTPNIVYVQQGQPTNVTVSAADADGNLRELRLTPGPGMAARWSQLSREEDGVVDAYLLRTDLAAGLAGWWMGNGNAEDAMGANPGTLVNGAGLGEGVSESGFRFDGADDAMLVPDSAAWDLGVGDLTIQVWVKFAQVKNSMFLHQQSGDGIGGFEFGYQAGAGLFLYRNPSAGLIMRPWSPVAGVWYHLAAVRSQGTNLLYVNGAQLGAAASDAGAIEDVAGPLRIGNYASPGYAVNGFMDEVMIHKRALSPVEIGRRASGRPLAPPGHLPFARWPILASATTGQSYSNRIEMAAGYAPYTLQILAGGLPAGLNLASDGRITGIPSSPGFASFQVRVTDALGSTGEQLFGLRVGIDAGLGVEAPPLAGIESWWRFEGDVRDSVGTNHGTFQGSATLVASAGGSALQPGGGSARIPDAPGLRPTRLTLSTWVKGQAPGTYRYLVSKSRQEGLSSYALYTADTGGLIFYVAGNGYASSPDAGSGVWDGNLHHVAGTYDGSTVRLYVDGVEVGTGVPFSGGVTYPSTIFGGDLILGGSAPSSPNQWPGVLDSMQLYSRALSASEIRQLAVPPATRLAWPTNAPAMTAGLTLNSYAAGTSAVQVVAGDSTLKWTSRTITVITIGDQDHDALADAIDDDIDGDGLGNAQELAAGTNPSAADSEGDDIPDNVDTRPLEANRRPLPGTFAAGGALRFDGLDDAVALGDNPALRQSSAITYLFWTRIPADGGRYAIGAGAVNGNGSGGVYVRENFFGFYWTPSSPLADAEIYAQSPRIPTNEWVHLALSIDFAQRTRALYVNGELVGSVVRNGDNQVPGNWTPAASYSAGWPDFVGGRFVNTMSYYTGELDEIQIWKVALTEAQVQAAMLYGAPTNDVNLVAYYRCDEASGVTAVDSSRAARNATLGGGVAAAQPERLNSEARLLRPIPSTVASPVSMAFDLSGTDPDNDPLVAVITRLPAHGTLYQTADGVTPGVAITNAPAVVTDSSMRVLHQRQAGYSGPDEFQFLVTDRYLESVSRTVSFQLVTPEGLDSDGDGLPDVYEFEHRLNPELADADTDFDGDGLTNGKERELGTRPDLDDTDGDLLRDGAEVAAGTDPFNRDTDSDGLIDGGDAKPREVVPGLFWSGPDIVTVRRGDSTNFTVRVDSFEAPLAYVGWIVTNPPPTFVTMAPPAVTNSAAAGFAVVTIGINPLHDAVTEAEGNRSYDFVVQAAATNGWSGTKTIRVVVEWEPTYAQVRRWIGPVSGSWSDPTKWDGGVPGLNEFAVIDATGTNAYTVTLDIDTPCRGVVLNSTNAILRNWPGGQFDPHIQSVAGAVEIRQGTLRATPQIIDRGRPASGFILNRPVYNGARIHADSSTLVSANTTNVWVDNGGVLDGDRLRVNGRRGSKMTSGSLVMGGPISWAGDYSPVLLFDGAHLGGFLPSMGFEIAGQVTFSGYATGTRTTGQPGPFVGSGTLNFIGSSYFVVPLQCRGVVRKGAAIYTPYGAVCEQFWCASTITVLSSLEIEPGGVFWGNPGTIALGENALLINRGDIRLETQGQIGGPLSATVQNFGTITFSNLGLLGARTRVHPGGELRLSADTRLRLSGDLELAGRLNLAGPAGFFYSRGDGRIIALPGAEVVGTGLLGYPDEIDFPGSPGTVALQLDGDLSIPPGIQLATHLTEGAGLLTLHGAQSLLGTYRARLALAPGTVGTLSKATPTFQNFVDISPGAKMVRGGARGIYLMPGVVVTNRGTISVPVAEEIGFNFNTDSVVPGWIENFGLFEVIRPPGQAAGLSISSTFGTLRVMPGGRLRVGEGTTFTLSGYQPLDVAGQVEAETNAELSVAMSGSMIVRNGARFGGAGTFVLATGGERTIEVLGDATFRLPIRFNGMVNAHTRVIGPGRLRLEGHQRLELEAIDCALVLAEGSLVTVPERPGWQPPFVVNGPLTIERGAELRVSGDTVGVPQMGLNHIMRNAGRLVVGSGYSGDHLRVYGGGRVENVGVIQVSREAPGPGRALVSVPISVLPGGELDVDTDSRLALTGTGVGLASRLQLGAGSSLEFLNGTRLTLQTGQSIEGPGQLTFVDGGLRLDGDASVGTMLGLTSGFVADGTGRLTLTSDQTLNGVFQVPLVIGGKAQAVAAVGAIFNADVWIEPGAALDVQPAVTINRWLHNGGLVRVPSRTGVDQERLRGSGAIENSGMFEVRAIATNLVGAALINLPIETTPSGVLVLRDSAAMSLGLGGLTNAGRFELQREAVASFAGNTVLDLRPGNVLPGAGRARFTDGAAIRMESDARVEWSLDCSTNTLVSGPGTLSLANTQSLTGVFQSPLHVAPEALVAIGRATLSSNLLVSPSGWLDLPGGQPLRLNGVLTNLGLVTLSSGDVGSSVVTDGPGCVVNPGDIEVGTVGSGTTAATLCVPLVVTPSGLLALDPGARLSMCNGAFLSVSGEIARGLGSVLRMEAGSGANLLALYAGSRLTGSGSVQVEGGNRLLVLGRATVSDGVLALLGDSTVGGQGRLLVDTAGRLDVDHSTILPGWVEVRGRVNVDGTGTTLRIGGGLQLASGGILSNGGTVLTTVFANEGGTVIGTAPGQLGAAPSPLRVIVLGNLRVERGAGSGQWVFNWVALPGERFAVETSADLAGWSLTGAAVREIAPGLFEARIAMIPTGAHYFRVRSGTGP